jgi:hypothetical protein
MAGVRAEFAEIETRKFYTAGFVGPDGSGFCFAQRRKDTKKLVRGREAAFSSIVAA